jgi:tetratricopeptide (TPR) repeat protein
MAAAPLAAQRGDAVPRRPALPAAADTNSARAYLDHGTARLPVNASEAADAFYWAYQLDPSSAEALYGRWAALLASNPRRLVGYYQGERRIIRARDVQAIDSLYLRALTMDPFIYRRHEIDLFRLYLHTWARQEMNRSRGGAEVTSGDIEGWINRVVRSGGPWLRGDEAYAQGRFMDALRLYDEALRTARRKSRLHTERARLFAHVGNNESALSELELALTERRTEDDRDLVFLYESKALLEHSVGMLHERMGNADAAREAYGRALTEDLAFYPAHLRMGLLALAAGDHDAAIAELDLASQAVADPAVLYVYGAALAQLGRLDESVVQLERAREAAPYYPEPWFALGMVRDAEGNGAAAVEAFRAFLERAPAGHARRAHAEQRVQALAQVGS